MNVWIDIENPPQVRYLLPFRESLVRRGVRVHVTARPYGATRPMLEAERLPFTMVGGHGGASKARKLLAVSRRAGGLRRFAGRTGAGMLIGSSRPAAIAARSLGIPAFIVCDYEHAELGLYRRAGAYIVHPEAIPASTFTAMGFPAARLVSFPALKEALSFAHVDLGAIAPADLPAPDGLRRVLVRPPAESSHYYVSGSSDLLRGVLARLAERDDAVVVYSPREPGQAAHLEGLAWRVPPLVLERPLGSIELLKAVDVVVSAGGTMLREAAFLGIPAISLLQSEIGEVDRALEREGRLTVIEDAAGLPGLELPPALPPMDADDRVLENLIDDLLLRAKG